MTDYDIDDTDVTFFVLLFNPTTWPGLIAWTLCALALWWVASSNSDDCSKRHCDKGVATVVKHNCVCLERATP